MNALTRIMFLLTALSAGLVLACLFASNFVEGLLDQDKWIERAVRMTFAFAVLAVVTLVLSAAGTGLLS